MFNFISKSAALAVIATSTFAAPKSTINGHTSIYAAFQSNESLEDFSAKEYSQAGVDLSLLISDKLFIESEILAKGVENFDAEAVKASINYQLSSDTTIAVGRLNVPFLMNSDSHYQMQSSYRATRPSIYNQTTFTSIDGISTSFAGDKGETAYHIQLIGGEYNGQIGEDAYPAHIDNVFGGQLKLKRGPLELYSSFFIGDADIDVIDEKFEDTIMVLKQLSLTKVADRTDWRNGKYTFYSAGSKLRFGNAFIEMEASQIELEKSSMATKRNAYVTLGYHFDSFDVYAGFEKQFDIKSSESVSLLPRGAEVLNVPGLGTQYILYPLKANLEDIHEQRQDNFSIIHAGLNWKAHSSLNIKLQVNHKALETDTDGVTTTVLGLDYYF